MDFKILHVAIITRSRLQTIGRLIPSRKWTFPNRLRNFETKFHILSGFGSRYCVFRLCFNENIAYIIVLSLCQVSLEPAWQGWGHVNLVVQLRTLGRYLFA